MCDGLSSYVSAGETSTAYVTYPALPDGVNEVTVVLPDFAPIEAVPVS